MHYTMDQMWEHIFCRERSLNRAIKQPAKVFSQERSLNWTKCGCDNGKVARVQEGGKVKGGDMGTPVRAYGPNVRMRRWRCSPSGWVGRGGKDQVVVDWWPTKRWSLHACSGGAVARNRRPSGAGVSMEWRRWGEKIGDFLYG
jgi:hypothetical protein